MNVRDSEIIAQTLIDAGYRETKESATADLIILNTCSIRGKAQQKVMSLLGYLRRLKKSRPSVTLCVAGCVAQQEGWNIIEKMPHVDIVIGTQHIYSLPQVLKDQATKGPQVITDLVNKYHIPRYLPAQDEFSTLPSPADRFPFSKFVTIMQGCNNFCTYCVVPYTRGRESSRSVADIRDEVTLLLKQGVVEITLLGQNVNSYGMTNEVSGEDPHYTFPKLLREIAKLPGLQRLRFTTSNPKDLSDDLMRCFAELPNLCPQFHLPVQSGSNRILKKMNRKYTREHYLDLVASLRSYCPEISLTTDVIVGFPGETDEDFEETMDILEQVRYDGSFSFKYSDRPGTASLAFEDKVTEEIKSQRLARFQNLQNQISQEKNNSFIGKTLSVLIEGQAESNVSSYKCRSATNHIVHVSSEEPLQPGTFATVEIYHAGNHSLQGKLVETMA